MQLSPQREQVVYQIHWWGPQVCGWPQSRDKSDIGLGNVWWVSQPLDLWVAKTALESFDSHEEVRSDIDDDDWISKGHETVQDNLALVCNIVSLHNYSLYLGESLVWGQLFFLSILCFESYHSWFHFPWHNLSILGADWKMLFSQGIRGSQISNSKCVFSPFKIEIWI